MLRPSRTVFLVRVVWVCQEQRPLIVEDRSRLLEGDSVLSHVLAILRLVPLDSQLGHNLNYTDKVTTMQLGRRWHL
jgi:hypothetical protein